MRAAFRFPALVDRQRFPRFSLFAARSLRALAGDGAGLVFQSQLLAASVKISERLPFSPARWSVPGTKGGDVVGPWRLPFRVAAAWRFRR